MMRMTTEDIDSSLHPFSLRISCLCLVAVAHERLHVVLRMLGPDDLLAARRRRVVFGLRATQGEE